MKILIAPDKFKGSLTAREVCEAITNGISRCAPRTEIISIPMADGGEGTLAALEAVMSLETIRITVQDPLFRSHIASYRMQGRVAYIEMAAASGLQLLKTYERDCRYTTSYGTGELIRDALSRGANEIYLFVGGSATNDAGIGMAEALGYRFLDWKGDPLSPVGRNLSQIRSISQEMVLPQIEQVRFYVVTDVRNPLYGKEGAAYVYAAQKGATEEAIQDLDVGLQNFSLLVEKLFLKEVAELPGAGAAGGMGAGAMTFLEAKMLPGIETLLEMLSFEKSLEGVDWVITGEGKVDQQTLSGKVVQGVVQVCRDHKVPVGLICGTLDISNAEVQALGLSPVLPVMAGSLSQQEAMENAASYLAIRAYQFMLLVGQTLEQQQ